MIISNSTKEKRVSTGFTSWCALIWLLLLYLGSASFIDLQAQSYKGPFIITKGGTYKGNWESKDSEVATVEIRTSEPVIIENSNIRGAGYLIKSWGYAVNLTVRHTNGYGLAPTSWQTYKKPRRFVTVDDFKNIVIENCYLENTAGIYIAGTYRGDGSPRNTVKIRYNKTKNVDGRVLGDRERSQFVQFNFRGNLPHAEIAWNQVINEANTSLVEDNISIYNSKGTPTSPIRIHNNFIRGAYPLPANGTYYTGGGILMDGDGDLTSCTAYVDASNNQLVNLGNHAMGIASGNNIHYHHNRAINSALFSDGSRFAMYTSGLWSRDYYNKGITFANNIDYNTVGVTAWGYPNNRNDISVAQNATYMYNSFVAGGAVPASAEDEEYNSWTRKLKSCGIVLGPRGGVSKSTNQVPVVSLSAPSANSTYTSGTPISIAANASDPDGYIAKVEFYQGSTKIGESAIAHNFDWTSAAAGTYTITAKATDDKGATQTSSAVTITVTSEAQVSGTITMELWSDVSGSSVKNIPTKSKPTAVSQQASFQAPINRSNNYGQRMRGYITAPQTGLYTFWLDANKEAELWLSSSENPDDKQKIAVVYQEWAHPREWPKPPSHQSAKIMLEAGKRYYIEALMKKEYGGSSFAVGWQLPDGSMERPIAGNRLSPVATEALALSPTTALLSEIPDLDIATVYPNPVATELTLDLGAEEVTLQELLLIDQHGRTVYKAHDIGQPKRKINIPLSSELSPGLYFLRYTDINGRSRSVKVIKN